jgi:hypothetical protein
MYENFVVFILLRSTDVPLCKCSFMKNLNFNVKTCEDKSVKNQGGVFSHNFLQKLLFFVKNLRK